MRGTIQNIQGLRGVAALLVLTFHLVDIGQNFGQQNNFLKIVTFGQSGVDLFFVISGFIIYFIGRGNFQDKRYQKQFLIKRFFRIYPVYWLYTGILLLALYIANSERLHQISFSYVLNSFFLVPQETFPLLSVGWTLIHEVFFYIVFSLLLNFKETFFIRVISAWGIIILIASVFIDLETRWTPLFFSPFYLEFIFGCWIAHIIKNSAFYLNGKFATILGMVTLIIGSFLYYKGYQDIPNGLMRILLFGIPATIIVYGAIALEKENFTFHSILFHLGNGSYSIYLSHVITIWVLAKLYNIILHKQYNDSIVIMFLFSIISVGIGIVSYMTIEKQIIRLGRNIAQTI